MTAYANSKVTKRYPTGKYNNCCKIWGSGIVFGSFHGYFFKDNLIPTGPV